jgi:beta-glucosidase/6-phospho-beta-glucosidase/beta-galactosidase
VKEAVMSCTSWRDDRRQECAQEADKGFNDCKQYEDKGKQDCKQYEDKGKQDCKQYEDRGKNSCSAWESQCCTWWPCSWACQALTWICRGWVWLSNLVCVAWVWLANLVCVVWVWLANVVCVAWVWIKRIVCIAWVTVGSLVCLAWEAITGEPPWETGTRRSADLSDLPPVPSDFLWGSATAGYQVEGAITNNDWHVFTTSPAIHKRVARISGAAGISFDLMPAGEAVHHHDLTALRADLDRAALLGLRAHRFSIEWSRVQPDGTPDEAGNPVWSQAGVDYYREVLTEVRERGLEPVVTLNHLTLPAWVLTPPRDSVSIDGYGWASHDDPGFQMSLRGWENPAAVDAFILFVEKVATEFKDDVRYWIPLNEPVGSMIGAGYLGGVWSPGFNAIVAGALALDVYKNLLKAHVRAYDMIKAVYGRRPSDVGVAHAMIYAKKAPTELGPAWRDGATVGAIVGAVTGFFVAGPVGAVAGAVTGLVVGGVAGLVIAASGNAEARRQFDYFNNWHFLDSLIGGTVDTAFKHKESEQQKQDAREFYDLPRGDDDPAWSPRLDFVGINYYRSAYIYNFVPASLFSPYIGGAFGQDYNTSGEAHNLTNGMGWEISPEGLYFLLTDIHGRYKLPEEKAFPLLITENGLPEPRDALRGPYIVAHLEHILAARRDGANVFGYLCWSLLDNFEWAENYAKRAKFGLFRVDDTDDPGHSDTTIQDRHLSEGALALQFLIAETEALRDPDGPAAAVSIPGLGLTVAKFGTINSDATACTAPTLTAGGLFAGGPDPETHEFMLYFERLSPLTLAGHERQRWLGMIFFNDAKLWFRLGWIVYDPATATLTFRHGARASIPARTYTAHAAPDARINGTLSGGGVESTWTARKVSAYGAWAKTTESLPDVVVLLDLEGPKPFGGWSGKFLGVDPLGRPVWFPLDDPVMIGTDGAVRLDFAQTGTLVGELSGQTLDGTLTYSSGGASNQWTASKLPDGLPF